MFTHPSLPGIQGAQAFSLSQTVNGRQDVVRYPAGWWKTATNGEIAALGFNALPAPPDYDPSKEHPPEWESDAWVIRELTDEERAARHNQELRAYADAVQARLDAKAKELRYDSIHTAATYAGDSDPQFAAEGAALRDWRSDVWRTIYGVLAEVEAGTREKPSVDELVGMMPAFEWPDEAV